MKKRKSLKTLALGIAAIMALTGCGAKNGSEAVKGSQTTETSAEAAQQEAAEKVIKIWIAGSGEKETDDAYKKVLDSYCSTKEGIGYEITYIPWSDYFTKLNTGLAGASGPDIFMLGYGQIGSVQRSGKLLNLSDYIPKDWSGYEDFHENILEICQMDGSYYALFKPSNRTFFYRKDIAEQNGVTGEDLKIEKPEDLAALIEKMTVKEENGNVKVYGMEVDPDSEQELFTYLGLFTDEPKFWNEDYTAAFDAEDNVKALTLMTEIYQSGNACLKDANAGTSGLASGVAAMCIDANSGYVTADRAFPGKIGVVENTRNTLLIGDYLAVNAATKYPAEMAEMFLHMFSEESLQVFAETAGHYSGRKSLDDAFVKINSDYTNMVSLYERSFSYGKAMHPNFGECAAFLRTAVEGAFSGVDPAESLKQGKESWNQVLQ